MPLRVCFLYIAQKHQVLHSLSAAVELARHRNDVEVEVAATSPAQIEFARALVAKLGGAPMGWRVLGPRWLSQLSNGDGTPPKVPMLLANAWALNRYDAIVAPERTTAALRLFGVGHPKLVYTQHGAGDRGGPFEPRLRQFDLVFAAGPKQRDRMLAENLVSPEHCAVVGYPKFDLVDRLAPQSPHRFASDRPVVLYNPHFDRHLSSWPRWGEAVLRAFADQSAYNLVFAPHLRLFQGQEASEIPALAPFIGHPAIHIDLGRTMAAIDMSYTRCADVYLGDVSSQVYEFLRRPKPCLFLNPHHIIWQGDESYRHWRFGPVLGDVRYLVHALDEACETHRDFVAEQLEGFRYTFDLSGEGSSVRAAEAIARVLGAPDTEISRQRGCGGAGSATSMAHEDRLPIQP